MPLGETEGVLLALDLGSARVGVAVCDGQRILAYPLETIVAEGMEDAVAALVDQIRPGAVIVGYPLALDGGEGIAAQKVLGQARQLARRISIPVWLVDERMTTAEAHQRLRSAGRNSKTSRQVVDAQAAVGILESVLYALKQGHHVGQRVELKEDHD